MFIVVWLLSMRVWILLPALFDSVWVYLSFSSLPQSFHTGLWSLFWSPLSRLLLWQKCLLFLLDWWSVLFGWPGVFLLSRSFSHLIQFLHFLWPIRFLTLWRRRLSLSLWRWPQNRFRERVWWRKYGERRRLLWVLFSLTWVQMLWGFLLFSWHLPTPLHSVYCRFLTEFVLRAECGSQPPSQLHRYHFIWL